MNRTTQRSEPSNANQRTAVRAPANTQVRVDGNDATYTGRLRNVSTGGAFIRVSLHELPTVGEGIRVRFRLPGQLELDLYGKVRWRRECATTEGSIGFGVEFCGLGRTEQKAIMRYVEQQDDSAPSVPVIVTEKYAVQSEGNTLRVWLSGALELAESRDLSRIVMNAVAQNQGKDLLVFIDGSRVLPCSEGSLQEMRWWMQQLTRCRSVAGVLVANNSIAMLQLRRLAREAGVGDLLVSFENSTEAEIFWQEIEQSDWNRAACQ